MNTKNRSKNPRPVLASTALLVAGIFLIAANLRAPITAVGPLVGAIRESTGISGSAAGLLTTITLIAFGLVSPVAPRIARRIGIEATLFVGTAVILLGVVLRSLPYVAALFAGTALIGMAIALGNVLLPTLIKRDFPHKLGMMTGIYSVSMNLWAGIASGVSIPLAESAGLGWRGSLGFWATLSAVAAVVWLPQLLRTTGETSASASEPKPAAGRRASSLWRSSLAWQVSLYMGLQSFLFYANVSWLPEILHDRGLSYETAGWFLSLMQIVSVPASFATPILAARLRSQRSFVAVLCAILFVSYAGLLFAGGTAALAAVWIVLLGIAAGSSFSLSVLFFSLRSTGVRQSAELSGMAQSIGYLVACVGPALIGYLHDSTHGWTWPLILMTAIVVGKLGAGLGAGSARTVTADPAGSALATANAER